MRFLSRYGDAETTNSRDDLAQDVTMVVMQQRHRIASRGKWSHYVRTVARRFRYHALKRHHRATVLSLDANPELALSFSRLDAHDASDPMRIQDRVFDKSWLVDQIQESLQSQPEFDRALIRDFYEGASLKELGVRYGVPAQSAKMRIHRCRKRLRIAAHRRVELSGDTGCA